MEPASGGEEALDANLPEAVPERWETAVEDFVQLVALAIDRAQDLADIVNDLIRGHPELVRVALAAAAGGAVGAILADRFASRPEPARESLRERTMRSAVDAAGRGGAILGAAAAGIRESAEQWVHRMPTGPALRAQRRTGLLSLDGVGWPFAARRQSTRVRARDATQLVPIAFALLRNPIVRDFLIRSAIRAVRARSR